MQWMSMNGGSIPSRAKYFFVLQSIQTGSGVNPAFCLVVMMDFLWRSPLSNAEVKNDWNFTLSSHVEIHLHIFIWEQIDNAWYLNTQTM